MTHILNLVTPKDHFEFEIFEKMRAVYLCSELSSCFKREGEGVDQGCEHVRTAVKVCCLRMTQPLVSRTTSAKLLRSYYYSSHAPRPVTPAIARPLSNPFAAMSAKRGSRYIHYAVPPPKIPTVPVVSRGDVVGEHVHDQELVANHSSSSGRANQVCTTSDSSDGSLMGMPFPVHRIYCVGRNYADHAIEMGGDPTREAPFFFCKPADAVVPCGRICSSSSHRSSTTEVVVDEDEDDIITTEIVYPLATADLHHEIELVVAIGDAGTEIAVDDASKFIYGYAVGVDLTRRDLQAAAKSAGRPWCTAKGFDQSAPIGNIYPATKILSSRLLPQQQQQPQQDCSSTKLSPELWLNVNGERRQTGYPASQMIWSVPEIVSILSHHFALRPGDLIFTGTPAGVAVLHPGDRVTAGMDGLGHLAFRIAPRHSK